MHWAWHFDCDWIQSFWLIIGSYGLESETTNHNFLAHCRSQLYYCLIAKKCYIFPPPPHTTTTTLYKLHHHIFLHALYMKNLKSTMAIITTHFHQMHRIQLCWSYTDLWQTFLWVPSLCWAVTPYLQQPQHREVCQTWRTKKKITFSMYW